MKLSFALPIALLLTLISLPARAQVSGVGGPQVSAPLTELFGEHKAFTATVVNQITPKTEGDTLTMPCKMSFLDGKCRMDIDMTQSKGSQMVPGMAQDLKAIGLSEMVVISLPEKDRQFLIYPGLKSYIEMTAQELKGTNTTSKSKMATSELGKESMAGHPCIKNKVNIIDAQGKTTEATVWNATDMKNFPVRIDTTDETAKNTMTFTGVKFDKPDAKLFEPPTGYTRYPNMEAMMTEILAKFMQNLGGIGVE